MKHMSTCECSNCAQSKEKPSMGTLLQAFECIAAGGRVSLHGLELRIDPTAGCFVWPDGYNVDITYDRVSNDKFALHWPKVKKWLWAYEYADSPGEFGVTRGHLSEQQARHEYGHCRVIQRIDATMIEE